MKPMTGKRRKDHHLPERVYFSRGWHFYVAPDTGKWLKLGKEWGKETRDKWVELSTGKAPEGTVADLLDRFLKHSEGEVRAGRRASRTLADNETEAVMLKKVFGRMKWSAVTSKHVARYLLVRAGPDGKLSPVRANREKALLSAAYSWAMGRPDFDIERNPCHGVPRNPESPRTHYLGSRDIVRFAKTCPPWLRCYILLKRLTALRQGDMLKLGRGNLTDKGIEYMPGKTKTRAPKVRIIRWSWALRAVMDAILKLQGDVPALALFRGKRGGGLTVSGFRSQWRRSINAWKAAGNEGFWEHDIRAKSGSDVATDERAQELLGNTAQTTKRHYRRGATNVLPLR